MVATRIALWQLTRDPALIAFFKRGAQDRGAQPTFASPRRPHGLDGGVAVRTDHNERRDAFAALTVDIGRGDRFALRVLEDA
jgi:hypothetical protein